MLLILALGAAAEARVFRPKQCGLYTGDGKIRTVVRGVAGPQEDVTARIRVRANSFMLDGANFRLSRGSVRGRYWELGTSMDCAGTYRKSGNRLSAGGEVEVSSVELSVAGVVIRGKWVLRLYVDGRRANYLLKIRIPDPDNPGRVLGSIAGRAITTKVR